MLQVVDQTKFRGLNFLWNFKLFDEIIHLNIVWDMKIKQIPLNWITQDFLISFGTFTKFKAIFSFPEAYVN